MIRICIDDLRHRKEIAVKKTNVLLILDAKRIVLIIFNSSVLHFIGLRLQSDGFEKVLKSAPNKKKTKSADTVDILNHHVSGRTHTHAHTPITITSQTYFIYCLFCVSGIVRAHPTTTTTTKTTGVWLCYLILPPFHTLLSLNATNNTFDIVASNKW